ncbi:MAG: DUF4153 domain-containing protein [Puniceicoccaceae bacterium]|nr:MAG: DUF4153 domain-containing protein [Puniceicoccaceae bacterium]
MCLPFLNSLTNGIRTTVLRFTTPTLYAAVVTGLLIYAFEVDWDERSLLRYILLVGLGFVTSLLWDLIAEARAVCKVKGLIGQMGIFLGLILYSIFIMPVELDKAPPPFFYGYFILLFALHLGIALIPSLKGGGTRSLWNFNLSCFLRYFFSSVNAALLFGGLALGLLSIDKLFEIGLKENLYAQLWMFCAFFVHPMLFLGGLPRLDHLETKSAFPRPLRFSLAFIGLPLVLLYLIILYAYLAKIILQWSWPDGWVAMPIFVLAVVSLLTYLLSLPLPKTENWARLYHRWLFRLLLPLAIVLFLALQIRLGDYGMTINRYLGLALAIWLFGIALAYLIRPALSIAWLPGSLLVVSLFSIYTGPFGAFGWSERAQLERLRGMAADMGAIENGVLVPATREPEPEIVENFQSALRYLLTNFGLESLEVELAGFHAHSRGQPVSSSIRAHRATNRIMNYLELEAVTERKRLYFNARHFAVPTDQHAWMIDLTLYGHSRSKVTDVFAIGSTELSFLHDADHARLEVYADDGRIAEIDLAPWAADLEVAIATNNSRDQEPLVWQVEGLDWRFRFVCTSASIQPQGNRLQSARFTVFLTPPPPSSFIVPDP